MFKPFALLLWARVLRGLGYDALAARIAFPAIDALLTDFERGGAGRD